MVFHEVQGPQWSVERRAWHGPARPQARTREPTSAFGDYACAVPADDPAGSRFLSTFYPCEWTILFFAPARWCVQGSATGGSRSEERRVGKERRARWWP